MPNRRFSVHRLFLLCLALAVFFACHLTKNEEVEDSFSFPALKDSIAGADQALIVLKAESGQVLDTLFNGPVTASTTFKGLKAPHFTGGKVTIEIQATQGGKVLYQITRSYDGDTDETLGTVVLVSPSASVKIQWATPRLREGDSVPLPQAQVLPATLADRSLVWASRPGNLLLAGDTYLKALLPGSATLVVWLKSNPLKRDSVVVEIVSRNAPIKALDSLKLTPDPLTLALRGPAGRFSVHPFPTSASKDVTWSSLDAGIVTASEDGLLSPVALGRGRILAVSKLEPTALDTAWVEVLAAVKVDSVRFEKDSVEVFVQGSPDSLRVVTYPVLANPSVTFSVQDASVAQVEGGKVKGLKEGETFVLARSVEDPTRVDSLRILVFPSEKVDSVRLAEDSLKLYVKGEAKSLNPSIYPTTLQKRFLWRSAAPSIATVDAAGLVSPVSEGKVYVSVTARADGQKRDSALVLIKKDTPKLQVGGDTVLAVGASLTHSPVVTQEYGLVVMFKWDLNGDGTYEDSSATVKPNLAFLYNEAKDYGVRFYVRDTEGNDTVVVRKVKAVNGRVVQILSPKDGSFTNQSPITVTWMVDGVQEANSQALNLGANTLVRSAQDSAKNTYSASITVTLDQTAPNRPTVQGSRVPVNTLTPAWSWTSGGGGGNGTYCYRLDNPDLTTAPASLDTFYTASTNQNAGTHTLYVQEKDEAGNWSLSGSFAVRIDTTAPPAPTLTVAPPSPTNNPKPTWSWTGGTGDAYRYYRYKLGDEDFRSGGKDTTGTSFTPTTGFADGTYTLYVQERDSAGNWSASASKPITIDLAAPTAPTVSVAAALTNDETPTWTWAAGTGGNGNFRYKINNPDLTTGATATTLLAYTPTAGLGEGNFTLYVQEQDAAGNWSSSGSRLARVDTTAPTAVRIDSTPFSPLNTLLPKWTWRPGYGGAKIFRARVDNSDLNGLTEQSDSTFIPKTNLQEGLRTLYVQERDSAGNWSSISSRSIVLAKSGPVGNPVSSGLANNGTALAIDQNNVPFIAYVEASSSNEVRIKRNKGDGWENAGLQPQSYGSIGYPSLEVDNQNRVYLAYPEQIEATGKYFVHVRRLQGTDWITIGDSAVTRTSEADKPFLSLDPDGVPYLAYRTWIDTIDAWYEVVVKRLVGTSWETIGRVKNESLSGFTVDHLGVPILALSSGRILQYRVGEKTWSEMTAGLPVEAIRIYTLTRSSDGTALIGFNGGGYQDRASIMNYSNGRWTWVGNPGFTSNGAEDICLTAKQGGPLYAAFVDFGAANQISLMHLRSIKWEYVGDPGKPFGRANRPDLAINSMGVPMVSFVAQDGRAVVYQSSNTQP